MPRHSNKTRTVAAAVLLGSLLAGCSDIYYDRRETVSFAAGEASATALATQTIDPWPPASANRASLANGERVAGAIARYRTGRIIQPQGTSSSSTYASAPQTQQGGGAATTAGASSAAQ